MASYWEYKVIVLNNNFAESQLNNFGSGGWELVAIGGRFAEEQYAYFKRKRRTAPMEGNDVGIRECGE